MNKRILAVIVALAVVVIAAVSIVAAQNPNSSDESTATDSTSQSAESSSDSGAEAEDVVAVENDGGGSYVDYSPSAVADADGRVILFFHATWCPQCVSADGDITASGVPSGITIVKVDYDTNQDLRAEYGVTQQTTFVEVDSNGEKVQDNFVATVEPTLNAVLTALG
ncbi:MULTISPECIES: thioredoxin family protein [unclassified Salinibacterium]|uniref:thioredoxin family protein n=1 Tax=unclassified Salinibacterium TaxID=2632331 RepID=UPI0018CDFD01|nr:MULTISPECIES: thioredoxin family protein [unclassified Salinibacterium]MBH0053824.1 thioredoxin family protein [Salinibacterium sp. SWN139]MBH0083085.1 thioredoxin family protein [Salinibacterium sp. SWN167]